ncbi:clan AA aspartic protease [Vicingus serpentipes]|uniref:Clan AA aspartic protease n=1 Tax=Vicingus serpentipes TaxID=1926625 RepID=A0A5C6RT06_9FLAO|nr:retropepsin-like aspartic protease [Vicingus serpentipes]TXB65393.1 clan AA aspartic protease [Vicingus serpentipes]
MKTILPITIFPIENDGFHLKVIITINGIAANAIIDTGASRSVFDETRIQSYIGDDSLEEHDRLSSGLGTNTMTSKKVLLANLKLGKVEIVDYDATILDLKHVNQSYEKLDLAPIDGIIGGDILTDYKAVIDYEKKKLILSTP